jgi:hypothetical protein
VEKLKTMDIHIKEKMQTTFAEDKAELRLQSFK